MTRLPASFALVAKGASFRMGLSGMVCPLRLMLGMSQIFDCAAKDTSKAMVRCGPMSGMWYMSLRKTKPILS